MKADGGALVYIILAVLSLVVSVVNQNNKKKAASTSPKQEDTDETEPPAKSTWEQEFEEIFGKQEPSTAPVFQERKQDEPEITDSQEAIYTKEAEEEIRNYKGEIAAPVISTTKKTEESPHLKEEEEEPVFGLQTEEFDLRKAIVYNEVLNRKYF